MAKFLIVHEDGVSWDAGDCPKVVYGTKGEAIAAATVLVGDNVKRAYLVSKVVSRVAAVVDVQAVDDAT